MADKQDSIKEYRVARWFTLLLISSGIVAMLVAIGTIVTTGILWLINRSTLYLTLAVLLDVFMFPLLCLAIVLMVIAFGQHRFAYLRVSPDGLEHRWWPLYHLNCEWNEVTRLKISGALSTRGSHLLVRDGRRMGPNWAWQLRSFFDKLQGFGDSFVIPLHPFQDWPKDQGHLARDLQQYIPHLFTQDVAEEPWRKRHKRSFWSRFTPGGRDDVFVETAMDPVSRRQMIAQLSASRTLLPILLLLFACMFSIFGLVEIRTLLDSDLSYVAVGMSIVGGMFALWGMFGLAILLLVAFREIDSQIKLLKLLDAMDSAKQSDQGADEN